MGGTVARRPRLPAWVVLPLVAAALWVGASLRPAAPAAVIANPQAQDRPAREAGQLNEQFDDPRLGSLSASSPNPQWYETGYTGGEYFIRKRSGLRSPVVYWYELPADYEDVTVSIDARVVGPPHGQAVVLGCRRQGDWPSVRGYQLWVEPATSAFALSRLDAGSQHALVPYTLSPAVRTDGSHSALELSCRGDSLRARIGGQEVARWTDATYPRGQVWFGVSAFGDPAVHVEGRFDNLVVAEAGT